MPSEERIGRNQRQSFWLSRTHHTPTKTQSCGVCQWPVSAHHPARAWPALTEGSMNWCLLAASDIQGVLSLLRGAVTSPVKTLYYRLRALKVQAAICAKMCFTGAGEQASATRRALLCVAVVVLGRSRQRLITASHKVWLQHRKQ